MVLPVRNIVIFGDPGSDRRFVLRLAGVPLDPHGLPPKIFEIQRHSVTISDQEYSLYHTAGLPGSYSRRLALQAREVLGNLYRLIRAIDGEINLLIYVVRNTPSTSSFRLFHDFLCQQDVPIILVQTTPPPSELSWFRLVLTLDGTNPEREKLNLQRAIARHLNKNPKFIPPLERFEQTARDSWKLWEKITNWSLADCRDALKFTFENYGFFSEKDAETRCESIVEGIKQ